MKIPLRASALLAASTALGPTFPALGAPASAAQVEVTPQAVVRTDGPGRRSVGGTWDRPTLLPPAPRAVQDTVDALYQSAREAMSSGEHRRAASLFQRIASEHAASEYASDARFWQAFNLYRLDELRALREALVALERQGRTHPDASTRENGEAAALQARIRGRLAAYGDEQAARAVREAAEAPSCDDETQEMRGAALNALVELGTDDALPILRELMTGPTDPCTRALRLRIPYLLGRLDAQEATDMLLELARSADDPEMRGRAVTHLGRTDDPRGAALLDELARSGPEELRGKAMYALVTSDDPRGPATLRDIASDPTSPLELRKGAVAYLGRADVPILPFLRRLFRAAPELRGTIVWTVSREDDPAAMAWLLEIAMDRSLDEEVRRSAIYRAAHREDGLETLLEAWDRLETAALKSSFVYGISRRDEPGAVDFLIGLARSEEDPELRKTAIYWLGRSDDPRAARVLKEIIGGGE